MITACYRYRVQGNGIGIGIGNGDIQCARQVLELKGIVVRGVGGHGEFQDLLAGAIGTIMVIGWECNSRGVGAPVGHLERGGIKGIVGGVAQAGVADVGMSLDALHGMGVRRMESPSIQVALGPSRRTLELPVIDSAKISTMPSLSSSFSQPVTVSMAKNNVNREYIFLMVSSVYGLG